MVLPVACLYSDVPCGRKRISVRVKVRVRFWIRVRVRFRVWKEDAMYLNVREVEYRFLLFDFVNIFWSQ